VIATDTPAALAVGTGQTVSFKPSKELDLDLLKDLPVVRDVRRDGDRIELTGRGDVVAAVMEVLVREQTIPLQTRVEQSTLDDAFVALTADADAAEAEFTR
jgi:ABC-2 type transport system ATP-binding protein